MNHCQDFTKKNSKSMTQKLLLTFIAFFIMKFVAGQIVIVPIGIIAGAVMPEHGFLPGKKFKFYSTINKYEFNGHKFRIELYDTRQNLKLHNIQCSDLEFTNTSEFSDPQCIFKVGQYVDTLFRQSGAILDTSALDTVQIRFQGIDARLIGFGYLRVHGLCQMEIKYHDFLKTYCIDITDADKNSPISPNAIVSRLTATRIMASASIREVIEQIIADLRSFK